MSKSVSVDEMANEIMRSMEEYSAASAKEIKSAVTKAANTVRKKTQEGSPVDTGEYKRNWKTKTTIETSQKKGMLIYNKDTYRLAHLLEKGHAKRNGGRVAARPHIAPAEEAGEKQLEQLIQKALRG